MLLLPFTCLSFVDTVHLPVSLLLIQCFDISLTLPHTTSASWQMLPQGQVLLCESTHFRIIGKIKTREPISFSLSSAICVLCEQGCTEAMTFICFNDDQADGCGENRTEAECYLPAQTVR